jgi:hypothetical protein
MSKVENILEQLASWRSGYLAPSAQILMSDAYNLIEEQTREIIAMKEEVKEMNEKLDKALKDLRKFKSKTKDNDA